MLKEIIKVKNPKVFVITPLLTGHEISRETLIKLKRNDVPFDWFASEGPEHVAGNFAQGIVDYRKKFRDAPPYVLMIDRDIIPSRHMIDHMYETIKNSDDKVAYCYVDFEYKGTINKQFKGLEFDPNRLLKSNYISSNSMIKIDHLIRVGGVVIDRRFDRLSDWAMWLTFLVEGYIGLRSPMGSFVAISGPGDVSAGSQEEYKKCYLEIYENIIMPNFGR
jgi:hypothetical protein